MSQVHHSENESEEKHHQYNNNSQIDAEFNFSLADLEVKAKLKTVSVAIGQGAKIIESFTQKVIHMLIIFSATVVALAVASVCKVWAESKLG